MSEQAEEEASQGGEVDENQAEEEATQEENPNALQSVQEAAANLLGGANEGEGNPNSENPENNEKAKKKRRVKKRVRVKKTKKSEEEKGENKTEEEEKVENKTEEEEKVENKTEEEEKAENKTEEEEKAENKTEEEEKAENKTEEEGENEHKNAEDDNDEYEYQYQYDYEYFSEEEEDKKSTKKSKKKLRYPDRPDSLSLSEPITHLDVPYDASTSAPRTRSPRKKSNAKQNETQNEAQNDTQQETQNQNRSFSSTTPRSSPKSPKSPREGNRSPRSKKNSNLSQTTSPRSTRNDESLPPLNNTTPRTPSEDVQQYVKKALNKEPILNLTDDVYGDILFDLAEKRKKYAINHNYKEGDRMTEAISFVEKCQKDTQMNAFASDYQKNVEDEKTKFENEFKEYDSKTQELFNELKEQQERKRKNLLEEQRKERDKHREKWTSDNMVRQYNKQSVQLTQMRKQHSLLLCQNRFKEAESLNNLIVQKAKQEEEINGKSYQFDYDSSLKMLKERQKLEIENFESQCENQFIKLKGDRARRRVAFEFREKKINSKSAVANDPEKIWNASMLQRVENNAANSQKRANMPSTRMKKEDLKDLDIMTLTLPPLKVDQEKDEKAKTKKKEKSQDDEENNENNENNQDL